MIIIQSLLFLKIPVFTCAFPPGFPAFWICRTGKNEFILGILLDRSYHFNNSNVNRGAPTFEHFLSQLSDKGFREDVSSSDNFRRSVRCVKCNEDLVFGQGQGLWTLKRHAKKDSHKVKTAWTIDEQYRIISLQKPGKHFVLLHFKFLPCLSQF